MAYESERQDAYNDIKANGREITLRSITDDGTEHDSGVTETDQNGIYALRLSHKRGAVSGAGTEGLMNGKGEVVEMIPALGLTGEPNPGWQIIEGSSKYDVVLVEPFDIGGVNIYFNVTGRAV